MRCRQGGHRRAVHGDLPRVGVLLAGCCANRSGDRRGERRQQGRLSCARAAAVARQGRHHRRRTASSASRGHRPRGDGEVGSRRWGFAVRRCWRRASTSPPDAAPAEPGELAALFFTSGTTGPSKAVATTLALPVLRGRRGGRRLGTRRGRRAVDRHAVVPPQRRTVGVGADARRCGRRCCRRHSGRAKCGTRCAPAAQRVSPEPVPWSRCSGTSRRTHGTRSFR